MAASISVIVPVRNGEASLPPLLRSLEEQTLPRDDFEVIVVVNGTTDRSAEVARAHGATVVTDPVGNRSRARNTGARTAGTDLFAFTDGDCVATPQWLERLVGCAGRAPLVAGPVETTTGDPPNAIERFEQRWRFGQEAWVSQGWAATANLLVHRAAFEAVGGFDTTYRHIGEDADFCLRAGRAGHGIAFCPDATILHDAERTLRPFLRRSFVHGYSVNQCFHRLGVGYQAWREPGRAVRGDDAMEILGWSRDGTEPDEWQRMLRLARLSYAMRVAGSAWAELRRVR